MNSLKQVTALLQTFVLFFRQESQTINQLYMQLSMREVERSVYQLPGMFQSKGPDKERSSTQSAIQE